MKVAVCVKQIPDPASDYSLDPDTHWLERPAEQVLDDTDRYGVEVALQIADAHEGSVTLISMGPSGNLQGIRQALAMGADDAVLVDDADLKGADALTTAQVLAAAIGRGEYDLVIAGTESTDGYSGVVPQQVAALLDLPSLTYATKIDTDGSTVSIRRQTTYGYDEVSAATPAVVSVTAGVVEPRYPTFKGIMQAKQKPVETVTAADLGVDTGVGQAVTAVDDAPPREAGEKVVDEGEAHLQVVSVLEAKKVL
ncbi:MAG: electron transfer flavoprotein subunit beta/FixA family protein [Acidimicrobiia bacterium]